MFAFLIKIRTTKMITKKKVLAELTSILLLTILVLSSPTGLLAQSDSDSDPLLTLYVDPATHIVYTVPGRDRTLLTRIPASALSTRNLEERQERTQRRLDQDRAHVAELVAQNRQLE